MKLKETEINSELLSEKSPSVLRRLKQSCNVKLHSKMLKLILVVVNK